MIVEVSISHPQHPSMDERERREINSSTMGFEEVKNISEKEISTRKQVFICYPHPLCNEAASLAQSSPQHKLPHEVGRINRDNHDQDTWDPIRLQGVSGLIGKRLPADHNQIGRASINLSPTPFAGITIISHILWISVSSLPTPGHRP